MEMPKKNMVLTISPHQIYVVPRALHKLFFSEETPVIDPDPCIQVNAFNA